MHPCSNNKRNGDRAALPRGLSLARVGTTASRKPFSPTTKRLVGSLQTGNGSCHVKPFLRPQRHAVVPWSSAGCDGQPAGKANCKPHATVGDASNGRLNYPALGSTPPRPPLRPCPAAPAPRSPREGC